MPQTGEEIRARLTAFAARWSVYDRSERAEVHVKLVLDEIDPFTAVTGCGR